MENVENKQVLENTNDQNLDSLFVPVKIDETESEHIAAEPYSYWKAVMRTFIKRPAAIFGTISFAILILAIIIIPFFAPEGYDASNTALIHAAPSAERIWGSDLMGRDLFFICFVGLRKSLWLALISSTINIVVGTLLGLAWGYFKKLDRIMIEVYNLISNVPSLLLYMLLAFILANSFPEMPSEAKLIISLTCTGWLGIALFVRNQTLIITNREYNVASITLGTPAFRIMMKNLLPYLLPIIITQLSLLIPGMISSEVSLSYFGVGLPVTTVSVGAVLNNGISQFTLYPWELLWPAAVLAFVIFTFYLIGLALSDAMDPKKHR